MEKGHVLRRTTITDVEPGTRILGGKFTPSLSLLQRPRHAGFGMETIGSKAQEPVSMTRSALNGCVSKADPAKPLDPRQFLLSA